MKEKINELFITYTGIVFFNEEMFENAKWYIDVYNNLVLEGDQVVRMLTGPDGYDSRNENDIKKMDQIEQEDIKTGEYKQLFGKKVSFKYVDEFTWVTLKQRKHKKITTNIYTIVDRRGPVIVEDYRGNKQALE